MQTIMEVVWSKVDHTLQEIAVMIHYITEENWTKVKKSLQCADMFSNLFFFMS